MKIQKKLIREYKGKKYYKFIIHLPPYIIEDSGLMVGEDLEVKAEKNKIILLKK